MKYISNAPGKLWLLGSEECHMQVEVVRNEGGTEDVI